MASFPERPGHPASIGAKVVTLEGERRRRREAADFASHLSNPEFRNLDPLSVGGRGDAATRLAGARSAAAHAAAPAGRDDARSMLAASLERAVASCRALMLWDEDLFVDVTTWERELLGLKGRMAEGYGRAAAKTGPPPVLDRTSFEGRLRGEVLAARTPLSMFALDVDRLSELNGRHGRDVGDRVLASLAERLRSCLGPGDLLAGGFDGADFAVAAPGCGLLPAVVLGERIRIAVAGRETDGLPSVTVSVGVASLRPGETLDVFALRVGAALRAAKRAGRNRVEADAGS